MIHERRRQQSPVSGKTTKETVKTIAQGMFWRKNSLNIKVLRMLYRRLCRDPQKLLIAVKNSGAGPLIRSTRCPVSHSADVETTHGRLDRAALAGLLSGERLAC